MGKKRGKGWGKVTCIKCGKEIPEGELFCASCSLNLQTEAEERLGAVRPPAPSGRMQKPVPVRRTPPQPMGPQVQNSGKHGLKTALVVVSLLLAASLGFLAWQYGNILVEKNRLRTQENNLLVRAEEADAMQQQIDDLTKELDDAEQLLAARAENIQQLEKQLSGSQSSQNQSEYDLSTAQGQLDQLTEENRQLLDMTEELEDQVEALEAEKKTLEEALLATKPYVEKANFMDDYVVFVEDDGTGLYHSYDCEHFTKSKFWAYSRRLAEANGYHPCPLCGN